MSDLISYESKNTLLKSIINPLPDPNYTVDAHFITLERMLDGYQRDWGLNLDPDFQRGHVWTLEQRVAYLEGVFRGTVGDSQRVIQFNAPHWESEQHGGDLPSEIQIVDGLQRLTSIRQFMAGELRIFNGLHVEDFDGSRYSPRMGQYRLKFSIHNFIWRRDLLSYYLDINTGGTPHSLEEIDRVKGLLAATNAHS